jgi:hypothetical protein
VFYYDDSRVNFDGPIIYTKCSKTDIYTLPTADMFIKIDKAFCICVTPLQNGNKTAVATGPLVHDFARDAVLIGREVIGLEGLGKSVEADHWNKVRDATCSHPSSFCPLPLHPTLPLTQPSLSHCVRGPIISGCPWQRTGSCVAGSRGTA